MNKYEQVWKSMKNAWTTYERGNMGEEEKENENEQIKAVRALDTKGAWEWIHLFYSFTHVWSIEKVWTSMKKYEQVQKKYEQV